MEPHDPVGDSREMESLTEQGNGGSGAPTRSSSSAPSGDRGSPCTSRSESILVADTWTATTSSGCSKRTWWSSGGSPPSIRESYQELPALTLESRVEQGLGLRHQFGA